MVRHQTRCHQAPATRCSVTIGLSSGPWRFWTSDPPTVLRTRLTPSVRQDYAGVAESVHLARQIAAERGYGPLKRKTPLPRNAPDYWAILKELNSPSFRLSHPAFVRSLTKASESEDLKFFVTLGKSLDPDKKKPAPANQVRFEHRFLIDNWLFLRNDSSPDFPIGVPGFCWFDTKTICAVFEQAYPAKRGPSCKAWDRMIEELYLKRMVEPKLSLKVKADGPLSVIVTCRFPREATPLVGASLSFS